MSRACSFYDPHSPEERAYTDYSYFSEYSLNHEFGPASPHSKYINRVVLQRYLAIGGVRIEDDILVTANGYENLTKAPKGEEMLRIILGEDIRDKGEDTLVQFRGSTSGRIERITAETRTPSCDDKGSCEMPVDILRSR